MLVAQTSPSPDPGRFTQPMHAVSRPYPLPTIPRMQAVPLTPQPVSTATGDPHKFELEVRPKSSTRVEVWVLGEYKVPGYAPMRPATPTPAWHGTGVLLSPGMRPAASPSNLPDPALNESNEGDALQLSVRDSHGRIAARGVPEKAGYWSGAPSPTLTFQTLAFDLDRPLPPDRSPYTITVKWRTTPDVSASSRVLISGVPDRADIRIGGRFIAAPYGPADVYRLSTTAADHKTRVLASEMEPHMTRAMADTDDPSALGPIVSDPIVEVLRKLYLGVPVYAKNYQFNCVGSHGWGAVAELKPGKALRIDMISRVGHVMSWLPDDPQQRVYSLPCNGDCSKHKGVFTDSPLVVGFKLEAGDTTILPQPVRRMNLFNGQCERGYATLQNQQQFHDIFSLPKQ